MPEPCIHELDPAQCGLCNGAVKRAAAERKAAFGRWFPARHGGKCSGCGETFGKGWIIRSDGDGGWLCGDCGDA